MKAFDNLVIETYGKRFIRASDSKIIHLVKEKDLGAFKDRRVDGVIMRRALETKLRGSQENGNVLFPEFSRFRMALKGMQDGQH